MRRAPSFHSRILPSRSLPMMEYSVEDCRTLAKNSAERSDSPTVRGSKSCVMPALLGCRNAVGRGRRKGKVSGPVESGFCTGGIELFQQRNELAMDFRFAHEAVHAEGVRDAAI